MVTEGCGEGMRVRQADRGTLTTITSTTKVATVAEQVEGVGLDRSLRRLPPPPPLLAPRARVPGARKGILSGFRGSVPARVAVANRVALVRRCFDWLVHRQDRNFDGRKTQGASAPWAMVKYTILPSTVLVIFKTRETFPLEGLSQCSGGCHGIRSRPNHRADTEVEHIPEPARPNFRYGLHAGGSASPAGLPRKAISEPDESRIRRVRQ